MFSHISDRHDLKPVSVQEIVADVGSGAAFHIDKNPLTQSSFRTLSVDYSREFSEPVYATMGVFRSLAIFTAFLVCTVYAQRPFYASSNPYPGVLPQNMPANSDLDNRFGDSTTQDPYKAYEKVPVYNVEKLLVERIKNEYPRDKQPFWYVNAAQLNNAKYQEQQAQLQFDQFIEAMRRQQEASSKYYYGQ